MNMTEVWNNHVYLDLHKTISNIFYNTLPWISQLKLYMEKRIAKYWN